MTGLAQAIKDSGVGVWHFGLQDFVAFIPCPGEKRVRVDAHDDLSNYGVYEVIYHEVDFKDGFMNIQMTCLGGDELTDWQIDLS